MANLFQKAMWAECKGTVDPGCLKFKTKERLPAFRKRCPECGSDAREVVQTDTGKVIAVALLGVLLVGGIGWAGSSALQRRLASGLLSGGGSGGESGGQPAKPGSAAAALDWRVETKIGDERRTLAAGDFDAMGKTFQSKAALHQGDRLRVFASDPELRTEYVFYRNGNDIQRLASANDGKVAAPSEAEEWLKLDNQPGLEEFIIVAAASRLPELEDSATVPETFNRQINDLSGRRGVRMARIQIRHE